MLRKLFVPHPRDRPVLSRFYGPVHRTCRERPAPRAMRGINLGSLASKVRHLRRFAGRTEEHDLKMPVAIVFTGRTKIRSTVEGHLPPGRGRWNLDRLQPVFSLGHRSGSPDGVRADLEETGQIGNPAAFFVAHLAHLISLIIRQCWRAPPYPALFARSG